MGVVLLGTHLNKNNYTRNVQLHVFKMKTQVSSPTFIVHGIEIGTKNLILCLFWFVEIKIFTQFKYLNIQAYSYEIL